MLLNIGFYMNVGRLSDDYIDNVISENYFFCRYIMICVMIYIIMWYCYFKVWGNLDLICILEIIIMILEWSVYYDCIKCCFL